MAEPGVIVMAVYRPNPVLLRRQLRSIIDQSLEEWRCIVGIDGPDEAALALVRDLIQEDPRFEVTMFPENLGVYRHFERLLALVDSTTSWVALADQDDFWYVRKLEELVSNLENQLTSGTCCQAQVVTNAGNALGITSRTSKSLVPLLLFNEVTGCLSIFKYGVVKLALPFPPSSPSAIHDHWLGVCAKALDGFYFSDKILQDYIQHADNAIGEQQRKLARTLVHLLRRKESITNLAIDPWEWRISMATALNRRITLSDKRDIDAISQGRLTAELLRLLMGKARSHDIPFRVAVALSFAAARRRLPRASSRSRA